MQLVGRALPELRDEVKVEAPRVVVLGVHEQGVNTGEQVDKYLAAVGVTKADAAKLKAELLAG